MYKRQDLRRLRSLIYRAERCQVLLDNGDSFRKVVKITKNVNELESIRDGVIRNIKQLVNLGVITSKAANAKIKKYSPDELIKDIQQIAKEHNKINPDAIETIYKALENLKNRYNAPSIKVVTIDIPRDKPESNHLREKYSRSPTSPKRRR